MPEYLLEVGKYREGPASDQLDRRFCGFLHS